MRLDEEGERAEFWSRVDDDWLQRTEKGKRSSVARQAKDTEIEQRRETYLRPRRPRRPRPERN